jgi:hypothetical protein
MGKYPSTKGNISKKIKGGLNKSKQTHQQTLKTYKKRWKMILSGGFTTLSLTLLQEQFVVVLCLRGLKSLGC